MRGAVREASDADKLSVCLVDDGGVVADVERDENGLVQVICGAPNVHAGYVGGVAAAEKHSAGEF